MAGSERDATMIARIREEWRAVPGWAGFYSVSTLGRVKSVERLVRGPRNCLKPIRERILKTRLNRGYEVVNLYLEGEQSTYRVHCLVADAFLGPRPEGCDVCHINGVRNDNRISNLRYGSRLENIEDAKRHGTFPKGESVGGAKLTEAKVVWARNERANGVPTKEIAKKCGVSYATIRLAIARKTWAHVS